jgi:hypothetical protein
VHLWQKTTRETNSNEYNTLPFSTGYAQELVLMLSEMIERCAYSKLPLKASKDLIRVKKWKNKRIFRQFLGITEEKT